MSLLDSGPEVVTVYPEVETDDGYGGTVPGPGAPVIVRARVTPAGEGETHPEDGYLAGSRYRLYARTLPAGPWSRVEWAGQVWVLAGEPQRFGGGRRLAYQTAVIQKRG
ncbi:hypothetical protein M1P56_21395 [Streptomyces sp. HU2014]|uniref:hypothetical protein n=1 Tax=Streptomyces sp. HU2014 TaxID=2939414 RepID=UPI00200BE5AE|nr:hypothetical protein [Streptomyces sp. HU2014]UQI46722.1 hypothetical protein M1P56_21395 [Streptomyces sp. HU2014]